MTADAFQLELTFFYRSRRQQFLNMKSTFDLLLVAMLVQVPLLWSHSQRCPHWEAMVKSPEFQEYISAVTRLAPLDIGIPHDFDDEGYRLLTSLLNDVAIAVRVFGNSHGFCHNYNCHLVSRERQAVLLLFCRGTGIYFNQLGEGNAYYIRLRALLAETKVGNFDRPYVAVEDLKAVIPGGEIFITLFGRQIWISGNHELKCLNCRTQRHQLQMTMPKELSLKGSNLRIYCSHLHNCNSHTFITLKRILAQNNASFTMNTLSGLHQYHSLLLKRNPSPGTLIYYPVPVVTQRRFPAWSIASYYEEIAVTPFERALQPMLREVVIFLSFDPQVWIALLVCVVACILVGVLVASTLSRKLHEFDCIMLPFLVPLLQQGYPVSREHARLQSFRIILGVWYLMVTVLATAYKGVITSLLGNVPLDGEFTKFAHEEELLERGYRLCYPNMALLSYPADERGVHRYVSNGTVCFDGLNYGINKSKEKILFIVFNVGSKNTDRKVSELLSRGYVKTEQPMSAVLTGPEMMNFSPFRKPISRLLNHAYEGGLFQQAAGIDTFKKTVTLFLTDHVNASPNEPLNFNDLRPAFVIWAVGIGIACLAFFVQCFVGYIFGNIWTSSSARARKRNKGKTGK